MLSHAATGFRSPLRQADRVDVLRVALDVTPLFGARTGVAMFTTYLVPPIVLFLPLAPSWRGWA